MVQTEHERDEISTLQIHQIVTEVETKQNQNKVTQPIKAEKKMNRNHSDINLLLRVRFASLPHNDGARQNNGQEESSSWSKNHHFTTHSINEGWEC